MPERQPSQITPIDEPPRPKCRSGILERESFRSGLRASGRDIFQCNKCDHFEIAKAEGSPHGEIYPPGEPGPAPQAPRGSARRGHPQDHPEAARGGGGEGSHAPQTKINHRGVDFTVAPDPEPNVWRWRFWIGDKVTTGKTETALRGIAARRAQIKIDQAIRKSKGDRQ